MDEKKIQVTIEVEPNTEVTIKPIAAELAKKSITEGDVTLRATNTASVNEQGLYDMDVDNFDI
ncbi:hypothetical protein CN326_09755 [Bacillus sp. AFS018417]|uniref:hypothetical protein n=1 Tax=Bacillus sp. AFS018417 TaxID=2033491 RepID=UPI000BFAA4FC|nr:hypothetical protein [Bacillus sp. AFS018417]PEZ06751.1 hypothetical protein CN326_09755 [Bacillus sp. AFS018417]